MLYTRISCAVWLLTLLGRASAGTRSWENITSTAAPEVKKAVRTEAQWRRLQGTAPSVFLQFNEVRHGRPGFFDVEILAGSTSGEAVTLDGATLILSAQKDGGPDFERTFPSAVTEQLQGGARQGGALYIAVVESVPDSLWPGAGWMLELHGQVNGELVADCISFPQLAPFCPSMPAFEVISNEWTHQRSSYEGVGSEESWSGALLPVSLGQLNMMQVNAHFLDFGPWADSTFPTPAPFDPQPSVEVPLSPPLPVFGSAQSSLWVNAHGVVSFGGTMQWEFLQWSLPATSAGGGSRRLNESHLAGVQDIHGPSDLHPRQLQGGGEVPPFIALFWTFHSFTGKGSIYFRESTAHADLAKAEGILQEIGGVLARYQVRTVFVATWHDFQAYQGPASELNTYQMLLVSDGESTLALMLYDKVSWTTFPGQPMEPEIGCDAGSGVGERFGGDMSALTQLSNANVPGVFVFRVDGETDDLATMSSSTSTSTSISSSSTSSSTSTTASSSSTSSSTSTATSSSSASSSTSTSISSSSTSSSTSTTTSTIDPCRAECELGEPEDLLPLERHDVGMPQMASSIEGCRIMICCCATPSLDHRSTFEPNTCYCARTD